MSGTYLELRLVRLDVGGRGAVFETPSDHRPNGNR